ncbi:MAG: hypothetical protein R2799_09765 [Crocinitomicaceae bacterium]
MKRATLLNSFFFIASTFFISSQITAQTGPGGIKSASEVQIWLDASDITGTSSGSNFSNWPDRSGNGHNFTQGTTAYQPTFRSGGINGKPYVDFFGDYMDSPSIPALDVQDMTWLIVGAFNNQSTVYEVAINHNYDNEAYQNLTLLKPLSNVIQQMTYAYNGKYVQAASSTTEKIFLGMRSGKKIIAMEDNFEEDARKDCNLTATPTGHNYCRIGMRAGTQLTWPFRGDMYEAVVISSALNYAELNILHNYLGAKYGITISQDYYDYEATHGSNLIGIGQEVGEGNYTATGKGIVTISGATDLQDGEYLFLGDDNVDLGNISSNVPASLPGHERFSRIWRVDEVGSVGDVTITLDLNIYAPGPAGASTVMLVGSSTDMSTATPIAGVYDGGANTISFTYTPNAGDFISFSAENQDIFSVTTGSWATPGTWSCGCIPTANDSVTVSSGDIVTVNTTRAARTVLVQGGGALDIDGGFLTISEDLDVLGDFDVTSGTIMFDGTTGQSMNLSQDADIDNIDVSCGGTFTITGGTNVTINGTLDISANINNTNTNLIINSSAAGDGRIGSNTGFTFTNSVTIRRYLPPGNAEYREVTPLTFNFQFQQWDDEMVISGSGFPDGCATQGGVCYYSVKYYDGTNWQDVTSLSTNYAGFKGYRMWSGDDLVSWSGATLESTGNIKTGSIIGVGFNQWNLIGNSYPSAIDFELLKAASTNMDYYFYIYNPNTASYEWYDAGATGVLDQYIAMGQGFWVKSSNGSPVVFSLNESHKTSQTATFKRPDQLAGLILKISSPRNSFSSKVAFNTVDTASVFEDRRDIEYLPTLDNVAPHLTVLNEYGKEMTVNYFNPDAPSAHFSLLAEVPSPGYYRIGVENLSNFDQYKCIHLIDIKTNQVVNLRDEEEYIFYADELKSSEPRFIISFANDGCEPSSETTLATLEEQSQNGDDIKVSNVFGNVQIKFDFETTKEVDINVVNSLGQTIYNVQGMNFSSGVHTFGLNTTGIVFVNCFYDGQVVTKKVFVGN